MCCSALLWIFSICFASHWLSIDPFLSYGVRTLIIFFFQKLPPRRLLGPKNQPLFILKSHSNIFKIPHTNRFFSIKETYVLPGWKLIFVILIPQSPYEVSHGHLDLFKDNGLRCYCWKNVDGEGLLYMFDQHYLASVT